MRLPWRHRQAAPTPRPDRTAIAVLEHDLLGIPPEPGSAVALAVALRKAFGVGCEHRDVADITGVGDPRPVGLCTICGKRMVQDEREEWTVA